MVACEPALKPRRYQSSDSQTGGFNTFALELAPNGRAVLALATTLTLDDSVDHLLEEKRKTVTGRWGQLNGRIRLTLDEPKAAIDSLFLLSDSPDLARRESVRFSSRDDTAFIYGFPCLLTRLDSASNSR